MGFNPVPVGGVSILGCASMNEYTTAVTEGEFRVGLWSGATRPYYLRIGFTLASPTDELTVKLEFTSGYSSTTPMKYGLSSSSSAWSSFPESGNFSTYSKTLTFTFTNLEAGTYYFFLKPKSNDGSSQWGESGDLTATLTAKVNGLAHIDNGASFGDYTVWIDNGSTFEQYVPYIDNGTAWVPCG